MSFSRLLLPICFFGLLISFCHYFVYLIAIFAVDFIAVDLIVVVAIAAFAEVVRADTCSSVASSTSIEIKQRFDLEYTSMLSIPASIKVICTTPNQEHGVVSIGSEVQERPSLSSAPVCTGKFDMLTPSFS